jgi:hypothetical protein
MRLRIGELEVSASVVEVADRTLTVQFRAPKLALHEQLLEAAGRRTLVASLEDEREWRIDDVNFGYVGSEPWGMHHHTWRLVQVERVVVGTLRLESVELQPYDYREDTDADGLLRFAARAPATDEQLARLARLYGSVLDVQRNEQTLRMRLEAFVWGPSTPHGQSVAVLCSAQTEPRVTLAGATPLNLSHLLGRDELLAQRQVADIDAWDL